MVIGLVGLGGVGLAEPVGRWVVGSVGGSVRRLVGWLVGRLVSWLVGANQGQMGPRYSGNGGFWMRGVWKLALAFAPVVCVVSGDLSEALP